LEAHSVERKLAAIFAADVEGYSRLMGQHEVGTLRTLTGYRVIIDRLIASHRGRIFNRPAIASSPISPAPWTPFGVQSKCSLRFWLSTYQIIATYDLGASVSVRHFQRCVLGYFSISI
jgi:class 3 adenylate cyclase